MMVARVAAVLVTLAAGLVALAAAGPVAAQENADDAVSLLAPRLVYYPMRCHSDFCRIDCFQNGISVASRLKLDAGDEVRLVVNAGITDVLMPRWIEIRGAGGVQTILLSEHTLCDLQALTIEPIESK